MNGGESLFDKITARLNNALHQNNNLDDINDVLLLILQLLQEQQPQNYETSLQEKQILFNSVDQIEHVICHGKFINIQWEERYHAEYSRFALDTINRSNPTNFSTSILEIKFNENSPYIGINNNASFSFPTYINELWLKYKGRKTLFATLTYSDAIIDKGHANYPFVYNDNFDHFLRPAEVDIDGYQLIKLTGSNVIKLTDGTDELAIWPDGSIIARLSDGSDNLNINGDGSLNVVTLATSQTQIASGSQIQIVDDNGVDTIEVNVGGSINVDLISGAKSIITDGTDDLAINADGSINVVTGSGSVALITKSYDWAGAVTAQNVWTPAGGKKFVITDIIISANISNTITLFDETDNLTNRILKAYLTADGGLVCNYQTPRISAAINNDVKITTSGNGGSVTISGYEI